MMSRAKKGFTMIEIMVYMSITALLLIVVISLIVNIFSSNRNIKALALLDQNERFIANYVINRLHNTNLIEPVVGPPTDVYFYELPDVRWNMSLENNDLIVRQVVDEGSGFPAQSTGQAIKLNSDRVDIQSLTITPIADNYGNDNAGVQVQMILYTTLPGNDFGKITRDFNFFATIR